MASFSLVSMSEADFNRLRNKKAVDIAIPKVLKTVLIWGCKKKPDQTFLAYLRPEVKEQRWKTGKENKKIDKVEIDLTECDVTLLNKLILDACDGFNSTDSATKIKADTVKGLLKEVTNFRNDNAHDMKKAISPDIIPKIEKKCKELISAAGALYIDDEEERKEAVKQKVKKISEEMKNIRETALTPKEVKLDVIGNILCCEGKKEMEETVSKQAKIVLPFSKVGVKRCDIYHRIKLKVLTDDEENVEISPSFMKQNMEDHSPISSDDLISTIASSSVTIIGGPGSGKSTLLKMMREDFVCSDDEIFKQIRQNELLLFVQCRDDLKSVADIIQSNFPKTLRRLEKDDVIEAMKKETKIEVDDPSQAILQRKLLICVDAIDELKPSSKQPLLDLIKTFSRHEGVKFVFTSRPGATMWLEEKLLDEGISNTVLSMQPLTREADQIEYLNRYQETIPEIQAPKLIQAFQSLDESCKMHLIEPIHLALFCYLYLDSPDDVRKWKDEISIMNQTLKLSKELIRKRLEEEKVNNPQILAGQVIDKMMDASLSQMQKNVLTLHLGDYSELCKDLFGERDLSYYAVLSCLFVSQPDGESFEYYHKSQAEFLAAKALLKESIDTSPVWSEVLKKGTANRFLNVFRLVLMVLADEGRNEEIKKCLDKICPALTAEATEYWIELAASCPSSEAVTKAVAKVAERRTWSASSPRHMAAVTRILRKVQPTTLMLWMPQCGHSTDALGSFAEAVKKFSGYFWLMLRQSYWDWCSADDIVTLFSHAQCKLHQFRGCIGIKGQRALASLSLTIDVKLYISLKDPMKHELDKLKEIRGNLVVRALLPEEVVQSRPPRPLPQGACTPPELTVVCGASTNEEQVAALIKNIAPTKERYATINFPTPVCGKEILAPMDETEKDRVYESDADIEKKNDYDPDKDGKWLLFVPSKNLDVVWAKSCELYRNKELTGIRRLKTSTAKNIHGDGVIMFHCGPCDDKDKMMRYGKEVIEKLGYHGTKKIIPYKTRAQSKIGTRGSGTTVNHLYTINVEDMENKVPSFPNWPKPHYKSGRYSRLFLENWPKKEPDSSSLDDLLEILEKAGVSTMDSGDRRWIHAETNEYGSCEVCDKNHSPRAGSCVRLFLPCVVIK